MEGPENQATRPISITPRSRQRRRGRGQEEMPVLSQSVPTTFYSNSNLVVPRAPLLTSQTSSREPPSNFALPPSPDFSGEYLEKFVGGRSLTTSRSEFPSSVPASFLSNRMQKLKINRKNNNQIQISSRKKPVAMDQENDSPSSSIHSGRAAEETEPPEFGSFTCFQILEEDSRTKKRPATEIQRGVFDGFSLGDQEETTIIDDAGQDDDDLQFNFD